MNENTGVGHGKMAFERYNAEKVPAYVKTLLKKNINTESKVLVEDKGKFWIFLTRGEKRTGGYDVRVSEVSLAVQDNGKSHLTVSYRFNDPPPGMMVTQALSYPVDVILLKGLSQKPDNVDFVKLK